VNAEKMQELSAHLLELRGYLKDRDLGYPTDVFGCVGGILDLLDDMRHEGGMERGTAAVEKEAGLPNGFSDLAEKLIIALREAVKLMDAIQELFEKAVQAAPKKD
jgi:hypothetical protein